MRLTVLRSDGSQPHRAVRALRLCLALSVQRPRRTHRQVGPSLGPARPGTLHLADLALRSILVGSSALIRKARHFRKLFGGGVRQSGMLLAAAEYALDHHFPLLPRVHERARRLAEGLHRHGLVIANPVDTGMVFVTSLPDGLDFDDVVERARDLPQPSASIFGSWTCRV